MGDKRCFDCYRCCLEIMGSFIGLEPSICRLDGHRIFRPHSEGRFCDYYREKKDKRRKTMLIRRCANCKHEYGFRETEVVGFTNGYCAECFYWIVHYNRWRRVHKRTQTAVSKTMMAICKRFITDRQKPIELKGGNDENINLNGNSVNRMGG